jgi:thiamine monophosphate synthase/sulfur carrier protein ThiS
VNLHPALPSLVLALDVDRDDPIDERITRFVLAGADGIVLRRRRSSARSSAWRIGQIREAIGDRVVLLTDDLEAATTFSLDLVLPERGIATAEARRRIGVDRFIARAVSSPAAATAAVGADLLIAGPIAPEGSPASAIDPGTFARIVEATWEPVLGISTVGGKDLPALLALGASGVLLDLDVDPTVDEERCRELRQTLDAAAPPTVGEDHDGPISIIVNGETTECDPDATISDLLWDAGLVERPVEVSLNDRPIARRAFDTTTFALGDRLDFHPLDER